MANDEEEEKDSEEPPEEDEPPKEEEEEEEDEDEEPQEERRPLMIPKIYIKKPPVSVVPPHVSSGNKDPVKPVEKLPENQEKKEEMKPASVISQAKEVIEDKKSNGLSEIPKIPSKQ